MKLDFWKLKTSNVQMFNKLFHQKIKNIDFEEIILPQEGPESEKLTLVKHFHTEKKKSCFKQVEMSSSGTFWCQNKISKHIYIFYLKLYFEWFWTLLWKLFLIWGYPIRFGHSWKGGTLWLAKIICLNLLSLEIRFDWINHLKKWYGLKAIISLWDEKDNYIF